MHLTSDTKYLAENAHITTADVWQDIKATNAEIIDYRQKRSLLAGHTDRLSDMKRRAYSAEIQKREKFVSDLRRLLTLRGEIKNA